MVDYSNKYLKDFFGKLFNLYSKRVEQNYLFSDLYVMTLVQDISELKEHPELFETPQEYQLFLETYRVSDTDMLLWGGLTGTPFANLLYTRISPQINAQINQNIKSRDNDSFETEYRLQELRNNLTQYQTEQITSFVDNRRKQLTNKVDARYTNEQIQKYTEATRKQLKRLLIQQEQQKDHAIRYEQELIKPRSERRKYKQWLWTPNDATRHDSMSNKIIPIEEQFLVHSNRRDCVDVYMDYPLDPKGPPCQTRNCLCTYIFTDKK